MLIIAIHLSHQTITNNNKMIKTTSLTHYKKLKAIGLNVILVTKEDLNK